jgi:RNase P/RNase MRP subunit p29
MKKIISLLTFLLLAFVFTTCKKENMCDCIKRTGEIITEVRNIKGFDRLLIEDNVNVFLKQDSIFEVKIEAGKNIVPLIKTELDGSTLVIRNKNRCNWTRSYNKPLNVYITMPRMIYIKSNGTGNLQGTNTFVCDKVDFEIANAGDMRIDVKCNDLITHIFGSGDLYVSGVATNHSCNIGGTSYLYAASLNTKYTWIHTFSSGPSEIYATDLLQCFIDRTGDVLCYGNPHTIEKTISGNGKLVVE